MLLWFQLSSISQSSAKCDILDETNDLIKDLLTLKQNWLHELWQVLLYMSHCIRAESKDVILTSEKNNYLVAMSWEGETHNTAVGSEGAWFQQAEQKFMSSFSHQCLLVHGGGCCISYPAAAWMEQKTLNLNKISRHPVKLIVKLLCRKTQQRPWKDDLWYELLDNGGNTLVLHPLLMPRPWLQ